MPKLFPYSSPEARSAAGEMLVRGACSNADPERNAKPDGPPIDNLLWEIGRSLSLAQNDLNDAHDMIPADIAPRLDTTSGVKSRLSDRLRVLIERTAENEVEAYAEWNDAINAVIDLIVSQPIDNAWLFANIVRVLLKPDASKSND
jgi:hypothetical protein